MVFDISYYNGVKDNEGSVVTYMDVLDWIKDEKFSVLIDEIRFCEDQKKKDALKKKLPAVTWSGLFKTRKKNEIIKHSGLICLDIDKISEETYQKAFDKLSSDKYVFAVFRSPSGNGMKILFTLDFYPSVEGVELTSEMIQTRHENLFFRALAVYLKRDYNLEVDESGKDVSRLCFLSCDALMHTNYSCLLIDTDFCDKVLNTKKSLEKTEIIEVKKDVRKGKKKEVRKELSINEQLDKCFEFTSKKLTYQDGKRNDFIHLFACNANRRGISEIDTLDYCLRSFMDYALEDEKQLKDTVSSAYKHNVAEFGKYKFEPSKAYDKNQSNVSKRSKIKEDEEYNENLKFWYVVEKVDKETGEIKEEVKFDHDGLTWFLANNGFRKLKLGDKGFQFVKMKGNRLESVEPEDINEFISKYLHKNVTCDDSGVYRLDDIMDDLHEVRKMYKRGIKSYTQTGNYAQLPSIKPNFLKADDNVSYFYFQNGIVEVREDGMKLIDYDKINNHVWENDIRPFEIKLCNHSDSDGAVVSKFLWKAITGNGDEEEPAKDLERIMAMKTTIGYLLSGFKDPTNTKCPVFQDKKVNNGTDAHGGSGKTLTAHIIGKMISTCLIDGKDFSFDSPYPYDSFRPDNKLIVYNDVTKKFPFERLFHKITEDFQYDKRYVDAIVIPHEDAPFHLVITNYSLMGEGSSFRRRQQIIEFCDYFNDEHTPKDVFGHRFFTDWDEIEWNLFYNFMMQCVQDFRKHGLIAFPAQNVNLNKLIAAAGQEFIDWMDEKLLGDKNNGANALYALNTKLDRSKIFDQIREDEKRYRNMENSNTFTTWVKMWANVRGLEINKHKNGNHDKSGRTYYWTFTEKN